MSAILMRMIVGIAALWLITTAYQTVAGRMAKQAVASAADSQVPPAFRFQRTDLSHCPLGPNGASDESQSGCGMSGPQAAIPQN